MRWRCTTLRLVRGRERRSELIEAPSMQARCQRRGATLTPESAMTKPHIACLPNGPYYLLNDMESRPVPNLLRQSGAQCATVRGVALCRCGGRSEEHTSELQSHVNH